MAKIVLGIGSSHGPQLALPPTQWSRRAAADRQNPQLWFQGVTYSYPDLLELRGSKRFEAELDEEKAQRRFDACQRAIAHLADTLARTAPDVVVILGDDQHEAFGEDNMPAINVYWGETIDDAPAESEDWGQAYMYTTAPLGNPPRNRVSHPTDSALGLHLIEHLTGAGFDVAHSRYLAPEHHHGTIGHAFYYVYRRLMNNRVLRNVPILLNTYYWPNQVPVKRCYQLGSALRQAIDTWDSDARVAIVASGGLSHFVIEEDLDEQIIDALRRRDADQLTSIPDVRFNSGTSEIRNWIAMAGALAETDLEMSLVDYVPCYRTEAGTGCAMGFAEWQEKS
ncbi:MAG TPA: protocatechuate 3,4-dioxygenase [Chloroflexota bacterium]|nr:protocatechuate 3,4-dioxygenase [Chloroflexota bacterium]